MKHMRVTHGMRAIIGAITLYELSLATNFLVATIFVPIIFFMGSDATPTETGPLWFKLGGAGLLILLLSAPVSVVSNCYLIFSRKPQYPAWMLWIIPFPFLTLAILSILLNGEPNPFIPFTLG